MSLFVFDHLVESNIHATEDPKEEKADGAEKIDGEKMAENCPKLAEDTNLDSRR